MGNFRNIIVIGASAGGFQAITALVEQFPEKMDAAVFVVLHLSALSKAENLAKMLQKHTSLTCMVPGGDTMIQGGYLYVAPANRQMLVKKKIVDINYGPHENKYRPSIDVLFRTAAVHYGSRVIGIILSGMLDDGTSGMSAIKRCGGICIVQDPMEAEFADMPQSVINQVSVDYKVPLNKMGNILNDILSAPLNPEVPIPDELKIEATITENMMTSIDDLKKIADHTDFTCPSCGGQLWSIKNDPAQRYRCYTGHVFTEKMLSDIQDENLEESIYVCLRMLEEKRNIFNLMATRTKDSEDSILPSGMSSRAAEMETHIGRLKFILTKLSESRNDNKLEA